MEIEAALRRCRKYAVAASLAILGCSVDAASAAAEPVTPDPELPEELTVEVRQVSCPHLDVARLRSLCALEMRGIVDRLGPLTLTVTCADEETRLKVDRVTGESAERSIPSNFVAREAERLLALAGAQLAFASWLDDQASRPFPVTPAESEAPIRPPLIAPASPEASTRTTVDIGLEAGARARLLGHVTAGPNVGVLTSAWRRAWGAQLAMGADRMTVTRSLGTAQLTVGELALSAAWRSSYRNRLSAEFSIGPALAVLDLRGVAPAAGVLTGALTGVSIDGEGSVGVRYRAAGFWALARTEGGYLVSRLVGTISEDSSVAARGPWLGIALGAGGAW